MVTPLLALKKLYGRFKLNRYFLVFFLLSLLTGYIREVLILFIFVTFHELSHVVCAYLFKLKIEEIELFPFGGVARIENLEGAEISKEVVIAIAGPAASITAAAVILTLNKAGVSIPNFRYVMNTNITLALFNLLPGLPLDGGRVLRALLSYFTGFKKATRTAAVCGKIVSAVLFILGVILSLGGSLNISLLIIPIFIFLSAVKEEKSIMYTIMKDITQKNISLTSGNIMEASGICAFEKAYAREVLKYFDLNRYHFIIVINNQMEIMSVLTEAQILDGLSRHGGSVTLKQLTEDFRS